MMFQDLEEGSGPLKKPKADQEVVVAIHFTNADGEVEERRLVAEGVDPDSVLAVVRGAQEVNEAGMWSTSTPPPQKWVDPWTQLRQALEATLGPTDAGPKFNEIKAQKKG